ncbi:hypothetical protein IRZ83_07920 [Flavobacterium sp. JLP]|uniref:hypothetical protein n=1 Tax=unclassified Flavobacterium TaxID=196869 RepID=UPI00188C6531|nr:MULTISPECIES: hypothetical protein [unclassified Flavobacterium]MBF4492127.1 hypothetical protein [Flavobacterium sp. MR2016-29]MBF4506593.1 hypothetical protein [Flavobacterium sp. JLP]
MQLSKQKKRGIIIFIILIIMGFVFYLNYKNLHVKFYNKTGEDIDSLVIAGTFIGHLKNGSSTEYINYNEFLFDSGIPYEQISGLINNKKTLELNWSDCGTERNKESKGSYIFDLKKDTRLTDTTFLYLVSHNHKIFWEEN